MPKRRWYLAEAVVVHQWDLTEDERQEALNPQARCSFFSLSTGGTGLRDWQLAEMAAATGAPRSWVGDRSRLHEHLRQLFDEGQLVGLRRKSLFPTSPPSSTVPVPVPSSGAKTARPTLFIPEEPGSSVWVKASGLSVYWIRFSSGKPVVEQMMPVAGKLPRPVTAGETYVYFSHRDDLASDLSRFAKKGGALPLLGPMQILKNAGELKVDPWAQKDWVIVRAAPLDGAAADSVEMVEQREDYVTTFAGVAMGSGKPGHWIYGKPADKDRQERWKGGTARCKLVKLSAGTQQFWAGTLSAPPSPKLKLMLIKDGIGVGSYNELSAGLGNLILPGHHLYDRELVAKLEALKPSSPTKTDVDALPEPPERFILPGDCCWQDQGQTNNCGAYSFSTAMNYWFPYTNYSGAKDGKWYANTSRVPSIINGARTPKNIVDAAKKFEVNGLDHDAEELDRARALKLLKCWVMAGVPTLVLVKEDSAAHFFRKMTSYHWKTVVGWDGERLFMNNSGGDQETLDEMRVVDGFDYDHAPVGNDVDPMDTHWDKWKSGGGDIVDFLTSVDECTFIPIYPQDTKFAGDKPR